MKTKLNFSIFLPLLFSIFLYSCGNKLSSDSASNLIESNAGFVSLGSNPHTTSEALYDGYMQGFWDQSGYPSTKGSEFFVSGPQMNKLQLKNPVKVKVVEIINISKAESGGNNMKEVQFRWEYVGVEGVVSRFLVNGGTGTATFKLFDDGWRVDNIITKESTEGFSLSAEEKAAIVKDKEVEAARKVEEEKRIAEENKKRQEDDQKRAQLLEASKIPTKTIGNFIDINDATGKPRTRATILTDVNVDRVGSPYDSPFTVWFGDIKDKPNMGTFTQTAFGWKGFAVQLTSDRYYKVVFKDRQECEKFYQALLKALADWRLKYNEIQ